MKTSKLRRTILKNPPKNWYLLVKIEFADQSNTIKAASFKSLLLKAMRSLYGELAASANIFIRKFDEPKLEAIVMVPHSYLVHLWTSIVTITDLCLKDCTLHVLQVSQHLMAIGNSSRQLSYPM